MAAGSGSSKGVLNSKDWVQVVIVAGIGTILEWFDFYSYSQLDKTLTTVFFGTDASDTGYWAIFGLSMAARPIGAIVFGWVGDTRGRSKALSYGIICMGLGTVCIGILPTYDTGGYTAGVASTVLLGVFRFIQGLAMGGEYGAAIVYVSEMAGVERRGLMVVLVQSTINVGLLCALALVMLLQATISDYNMLVWGWRIPFLLAFFTALLGFYLRRGMPEPHAFLAAARRERLVGSRAFTRRQLSLLGEGAAWEAAHEAAAEADMEVAAPKSNGEGPSADKQGSDGGDGGSGGEGGEGGEEAFSRAVSLDRSTTLARLHTDVSNSKVPVLRVLRNNWAGLLIQVAFSAWASGALYITNSWIPSRLRKAGLDRLLSQAMLLVSIAPSLLCTWGTGYLLDRGVPAVRFNAALVTAGAGAAFGIAYGSFSSTLGAWLLSSLGFGIVGAALALIGLPATRVYAPLERVTGFSVGYSCAMGFLGGFTPNICNAIAGALGGGTYFYAGAFWLLALWGASMLGCALLRLYTPRLDKRFVGHIE